MEIKVNPKLNILSISGRRGGDINRTKETTDIHKSMDKSSLPNVRHSH